MPNLFEMLARRLALRDEAAQPNSPVQEVEAEARDAQAPKQRDFVEIGAAAEYRLASHLRTPNF